MSEKYLLMLGTMPLETPEEVFQICGRTIGNSPALFSAEDQGGPSDDLDSGNVGHGSEALEAAVPAIREKAWCFLRSKVSPICRDWLLRVAFYPALSRARLRRVTFRTLRHSCACEVIASGALITSSASHRPRQSDNHASGVLALL